MSPSPNASFASRAQVAASALLASMVVLWAAGCSKKKETSEHEIIPITADEEKRGIEACTAYVERLCRCAETHAEYADECAMIRRARVEALRKAVAASRREGEGNHVRWRTGVTARRLIARCIEADNKLDLSICPRAPATGAGAAP